MATPLSQSLHLDIIGEACFTVNSNKTSLGLPRTGGVSITDCVVGLLRPPSLTARGAVS